MPSAMEAAMAGGYAIEVDLQGTVDGGAVVHHDSVLGRLTIAEGKIASMTVSELKKVSFKSTSEKMLTLEELLELVAGRTTLLLELKGGFNRLTTHVAKVLAGYAGPVAAMSCDPQQVAALRSAMPELTCGIVAAWRAHGEPGEFNVRKGRRLAHMAKIVGAAPQFLALRADDLPSAVSVTVRSILRKPILAWTIRNESERISALRLADQIIFENFTPGYLAASSSR